MANKKTIIGMAALVGVLAVTAVCNFALANSSGDTTADGELTSSNYFETYRAERTASRSEELIQLDSVIALYEEGETKYEEAYLKVNEYLDFYTMDYSFPYIASITSKK